MGRAVKINPTVRREHIDRSRRVLAELLAPETRKSFPFAVVTRVSQDGMSRSIRVMTIGDGGIVDLSWRIAVVLDFPHDGRSGVTVRGCGMDMIFHTLYELWLHLRAEGLIDSHADADDEDYAEFCRYAS